MMRKPLSSVELLVLLANILILLGCVGFVLPFVVLFHLAFGWIFYLYRTLPQVRINLPGVLTATVCLGALAIGLQWFLRWFAAQTPSDAADTNSTASSWPARRTGVILGLTLLLFVAGVAAAGISHQIGWLLTSPEPIVESGSVRKAAARAMSQNNLKQMAVAMHNYHEIEKALPSAAVYDRQGQPLLSWRVLILPYVEEESLYKEFRLDEPWDSPHNLRLLPRMPRIYAPLGDIRSPKRYSTPFQVFVGKGTAFEGKRGLRIPEDFPDGTANTFLIVEAAELVPWTKPVDLSFHRSRPLPTLGLSSSREILAVRVDTSIYTGRLLSESTLRAAITRNGSDTLGPDW